MIILGKSSKNKFSGSSSVKKNNIIFLHYWTPKVCSWTKIDHGLWSIWPWSVCTVWLLLRTKVFMSVPNHLSQCVPIARTPHENPAERGTENWYGSSVVGQVKDAGQGNSFTPHFLNLSKCVCFFLFVLFYSETRRRLVDIDLFAREMWCSACQLPLPPESALSGLVLNLHMQGP